MSDQSAGPLGLPPSVWMVLVAGLVGVFAANQHFFQDVRPGDSATPAYRHIPSEDQDVEARQWEDPFSAVAIARRGSADEPAVQTPVSPVRRGTGDTRHSIEQLAREVQQIEQHADRVLIIGAMLPGAPYADDIETRRRTRYAALAGLSSNGYVPDNAEHIGYVTLPLTYVVVARSEVPHAAPDIAAYEWFHQEMPAGDTPARHVLLLWLDQDGFRDAPIGRFSYVINTLAPQPDAKATVIPMILGPADSDGLRAMNREMSAEPPGACEHVSVPMRDLWIYSPRATAADWWIEDQPVSRTAGDIEPFDLARHFQARCKRVFLYRTVSDDFMVAQALFKELNYRGVEDVSQIALVYERDALNSRLMSRYFNGCEGTDDTRGPTVGGATGAAKPLCFTYLRGLDGLAPPAPDAGGATPKEGGAKNQSSAATPVVRDTASGQGQLDYLHRMTTALVSLRDDPTCHWMTLHPAAKVPAISASRCSHRIKAIGVVGSDIYDKLMVLQALRAAFPRYIFFSTDLDARLTDAANLPWTHELIVGSSLGLALRPELQGGIPPFRDSYQTVTYYTMLHAVKRFAGAQAGSAPGAASLKDFAWDMTPHVFEIGRTQLFDMTKVPGADLKCPSESDCKSIAAIRGTPRWSTATPRTILSAGCFAIVIAVLIAMSAMGFNWCKNLALVRPESQSQIMPIDRLGLVLIALLCIGVLACDAWKSLLNVLGNGGTRIPPPIFSGASQWPASVIEALTILVAVTLVMRGQRKLRLNAATMLKELHVRKRVRALVAYYHRRVRKSSSADQRRERFWFPVRRLTGRSRRDSEDLPAYMSPLEALIAQYLYRGRWTARLLRVALTTALATIALVILEYVLMSFEFDLGISLARNFEVPDTRYIERHIKDLLSLLNLAGMEFLIFWVADAMLLTRSFALALTNSKPAWPERVLAIHREELGLDGVWVRKWLYLRMIAWRTGSVASLIWYPSGVLAAMAVAASTVEFGQFGFASNPIALIISAAFVITAAVLLRRVAESWRQDVLFELDNARLRAAAGAVQPHVSSAQLDRLAQRVQELSEGAFAPYSQQPIVRAVLVPALTYAATSGLQLFHGMD